MRIMNLLKNNRILKRSLALLLSVMVLVSAVDVLMVSVFADGNEYSGDAYTVTTNAMLQQMPLISITATAMSHIP